MNNVYTQFKIVESKKKIICRLLYSYKYNLTKKYSYCVRKLTFQEYNITEKQTTHFSLNMVYR
jgi:hypothetical protein